MDVTHLQRALWMVLITWLAAPFFAALTAAAMSLLAPVIGALPTFEQSALGEAAAGTFVWSALPAAVAGLALVPFVLERGTYGWLHAAVAGVAGFFAGFMIQPFAAGSAMPLLAFIAALIVVGMRALLINRKILLP